MQCDADYCDKKAEWCIQVNVGPRITDSKSRELCLCDYHANSNVLARSRFQKEKIWAKIVYRKMKAAPVYSVMIKSESSPV